MKLDKVQKKELLSIMKGKAENKGYKIKNNTIYFLKESCFIHCDFLIVDSEKIVYRIYIKNYIYDDIFWNILHLQDNSKKNDSLRACGAFKAPSILIEKGEMELSDKYNIISKSLLEKITKSSDEFINNYEIDNYVINYENGIDKEILQCLAYIHMNENDKAKDIAKNAIISGNKGEFENQGKAFFEWVMLI